MRQVNWGILSTARINRRLIPPINASEQSQVLAVASRNQGRAQEYANEWGIPRAYGGYDALLADRDIDVVYISLPNDQHTSWTIKALEAGKHVLCEKPMCLTLEELIQVEEASRRTGRSVQEGIMYLHHPQTHHYKNLVESGAIGELRYMHSEFTFNWTRDESNYRLTNPHGGGALWDIGIYPVSFFLTMAGSTPRSVQGVGYPGEIDMRFSGILTFDRGISGTFTVGFDSSFSTRTSIVGTLGRIDVSHPYNYVDESEAFLTTDDGRKQIEIADVSLYSLEVENMNAIACGEGGAVVTMAKSRSILETILRLRSFVQT